MVQHAKRFKRKHFKRVGARVGSSVGNAAYTALKIARKLRAEVNTEYKFFDVSTASVQPDYSGTIATLNVPSQLLTDNGRVGDSMKCQRIVVKGAVTNSATSNIYSHTRVLLIWDPQNKISTMADVLEVTGSALAPYSPKMYDKRFQCQVMYDRKFTTSTFTGSQAFWREFTISKNILKHTQFNNGTININTGALKLCLISNLLTNLPNVEYYARLTYTDN